MFAKRTSLIEHQSLDENMAHLDFRQAFSSPGDPVHPVAKPTPGDFAVEATTSHQQRRALATRLPRLHQADRTTFLFAILIFVGGLFCALFFFNGVEILRAAAAWSREFLYPRPPALIANNGIDNSSAQAGPESPASSARLPNSDKKEGDKTSPFRSDVGSLYPPLFNNLSSASASAQGPGSPLSDLSVPAPGGDALLQSLNQAAENIARATSLFANSTATVVKTTVVQAPAKMNGQLNSARQTAQTVVSGTSVQTNAKQASRVLNRTRDRATSSALNLRNNLGQGLGGLGIGGGGDAAGSVSGLGGAAGGAIGGVGGIEVGLGGR